MKRLKYCSGLCGNGQTLYSISILACLAWTILCPWLEMHCGWEPDESVVLMVYPILLFAPSLVTWLVLHCYLNKAERELVRKAQPLVWERLSRKDYDHFRYENYFIRFLGMFVVLGILGIIAIIAAIAIPDKAYWSAIYAVITGLCLIVTLLDHHFWKHIDESAECAELPVHHSYTRYWHSKTGKHLNTIWYAICRTGNTSCMMSRRMDALRPFV